MTSKYLLLLAGSVLLAACGGGGSGGSNPVTMPSPTPSPSPSPSPTPSPSYTQYDSLTGNQTFDTSCALAYFRFPGTQVFPASPYGSDTTLTYDATDMSYRIQGLQGIDVTYGPDDLDTDDSFPTNENFIVYERPTTFNSPELLIIGDDSPGVIDADYVRVFVLLRPPVDGDEPVTANCVFGVPTLVSDRPTENQVTFANTLSSGSFLLQRPSGEVESYSVQPGTSSLSVDLTTGTVSPTFDIVGRRFVNGVPSGDPVNFGSFSGSGTIDDVEGSYQGDLTSNDVSVSLATFGGWFFGPQGVEAGMSITVQGQLPDGTNIFFAGFLIASR